MKTPAPTLRAFLFAAALLACGGPAVQADPAGAEDNAYRLAVKFVQRGFAMAPTNNSGVGGTGYTVRFLVPVSKGVDYIFLCGMDAMVQRSGIYVYDEVGNLILDDRRGGKNSGVQFRSSYNGTVQVYVHIARANGLGAYAVLVGRRGEERRSEATQMSDPG